jgi:hypothetical protein
MRTSVRGVRVVWEPPNDGLSRGFSDEGHELAQVAHVYSPTGDDIGWVAWLRHGGELFDQFATLEAARHAVETALDGGLT